MKKTLIYTVVSIVAYSFLVLLITSCGRDTQPGAYRGRLGGGPVVVHKAVSIENADSSSAQ